MYENLSDPMPVNKEIKLYSGTGNPALAEKIKQAFLALDPAKPADKEILDLQAASRFIETNPDHYKGIEESARAAGLLK